jgi:hypothetical protein
MAAPIDEWDCSDNDLPLDDSHVAGIKDRKKIADDFLKSLERSAEQTLTNPSGFQALWDLVDRDVPRMLREIVSLRPKN